MDSPSQGVKGIPVTVTLCTADTVSLACSAIGASYDGRIQSGMVRGIFRQNGYSFPLDLSPDSAAGGHRPQTPVPPFPYSVTDTVFTAPDGAIMSATLTMPPETSDGGVPAVVMVTGSGPQNRDEEIFGHRPFAVIADYLARNGIASLRYDDRGTARSSGNFLTATITTFKDDAMSGISFLRSVPGIGKAGVLGHSEGGTVAMMLGAEGVPDFIISLAGMAVSGKETLLRQNSYGLEKAGLSGADLENCLRLTELVFDAMDQQYRTGKRSPVDIDSIAAASGLTVNPVIAPSLIMSQKKRTPWFDAFIGLDPRAFLGNIRCPLLAVNGDRDIQVDVRNLDVIREYVPEADIRLMPGLNHLMQHAVTGGPDEYGVISETISPEVLDIIAGFIKQHGRND